MFFIDKLNQNETFSIVLSQFLIIFPFFYSNSFAAIALIINANSTIFYIAFDIVFLIIPSNTLYTLHTDIENSRGETNYSIIELWVKGLDFL